MSQTIIRFNWDDLDERFDEDKDIIEVDAALPLTDAAAAFNANQFAQINQWLDAGQLREISDDTANAWFDTNQALDALETDEWILLQVPAAS